MANNFFEVNEEGLVGGAGNDGAGKGVGAEAGNCGLWSITLSLSLGAVLLNKSPGDGQPNHLGRCNGDSKRLAESCDQRGKSQGPVGLIWIQRVPGRRHTCKNIDGISD